MNIYKSKFFSDIYVEDQPLNAMLKSHFDQPLKFLPIGSSVILIRLESVFLLSEKYGLRCNSRCLREN